MKDLDNENWRLKQMFADLSLENRTLKDVIEKNFKTRDKAWTRQLYERKVFNECMPGIQDVIAEQDGLF